MESYSEYLNRQEKNNLSSMDSICTYCLEPCEGNICEECIDLERKEEDLIDNDLPELNDNNELNIFHIAKVTYFNPQHDRIESKWFAFLELGHVFESKSYLSIIDGNFGGGMIEINEDLVNFLKARHVYSHFANLDKNLDIYQIKI